MEINKFKDKGKLYYAVTGNCLLGSNAIKTVIRYKKDSLANEHKYNVFHGVIVDAGDKLELWRLKDVGPIGEQCWIVCKK